MRTWLLDRLATVENRVAVEIVQLDYFVRHQTQTQNYQLFVLVRDALPAVACEQLVEVQRVSVLLVFDLKEGVDRFVPANHFDDTTAQVDEVCDYALVQCHCDLGVIGLRKIFQNLTAGFILTGWLSHSVVKKNLAAEVSKLYHEGLRVHENVVERQIAV